LGPFLLVVPDETVVDVLPCHGPADLDLAAVVVQLREVHDAEPSAVTRLAVDLEHRLVGNHAPFLPSRWATRNPGGEYSRGRGRGRRGPPMAAGTDQWVECEGTAPQEEPQAATGSIVARIEPVEPA